MATVRSLFLAHMLFFTTRTAWHCESLQWYINLSQSANPSVFPKGFRDDCNWALSSAVGCAIDKWPNSHFCQRAYADIAPNISVMIKFLTMVQHCSLLIQKWALLIQLHSHYSLPKLRGFTGRETLVKSVGEKKSHTSLTTVLADTAEESLDRQNKFLQDSYSHLWILCLHKQQGHLNQPRSLSLRLTQGLKPWSYQPKSE